MLAFEKGVAALVVVALDDDVGMRVAREGIHVFDENVFVGQSAHVLG